MSDEGEASASIQARLDTQFESKRLIQSSHHFRKNIEALEKAAGYKKNTTASKKQETFWGCRITNPMKEMSISENEFEILNEFLLALTEMIEARNNWLIVFRRTLTNNKLKPSVKKAVRTSKNILGIKTARLKIATFRVFILEIAMKYYYKRNGSSLTWFSLLFPQLNFRNKDLLIEINDALKSYTEKLDEINSEKGLDYCVEEFLLKHFESKERK